MKKCAGLFLIGILAGPALAAFDPDTGAISNERWGSGVNLGGIGCGKIEILTDGSIGFFTGNHNWDRPTGRLKGAFAAVYAESGAKRSARMLRLSGSDEYAGVDNVAGVEYRGLFPTATLRYSDPALPVKVELLAWSPLIPRNVADSSLPIANFRFTVTNPNAEPAKAVVLMAWPNLLGWGGNRGASWTNSAGNRQELRQSGKSASLLYMRDPASPVPTPDVQGEHLLSVGGEVSATSCAPSFDGAAESLPFWSDFRQSGALQGATAGAEPAGALAAAVELKPGESREVAFILVWHMPHHVTVRTTTAPTEEFEPSTAGVESAIDGLAHSRWCTGRSMQAGDSFTLDLGQARKVSRVVFDTSGSPNDYPRGYRVEVSADGNAWQKIAEAGAGEFPASASLSVPVSGQSARLIRLTQLGSVWWFWSIHEVSVYDDAGQLIPRAGWKASASLVRMKPVEQREDVGHYYSNRFKSAQEIAQYAGSQAKRLLAETQEWQGLIGDSSLPSWLKLKLVNCAFPLYSCSVFTRDGRFVVQESPVDMGGATGTMDQRMAAHAIYTQLFPELDETELRIFARCQDLVPTGDGQLPHFDGNIHEVIGNPNVGYGVTGWPDLSCSWVMQVLKLYRWTGDEKLLDDLWPHVKRALAWLKSADRDGDNIPEGGSTYDYEALPPGAFIYNASCYLGALRAGMAMARARNDAALEKSYADQFRATQESVMKSLWNGKFFIKYRAPGSDRKNPNSFIAQLAGDWLSRLGGCGRTLAPEVTDSAIREIIARNVKPFFPVPPMEVTPEGRVAAGTCYLLQHEPYAGCEAINEGYTDDGLEVIRRIYETAWIANADPWHQHLDYAAPSGTAGGLIGYMTCPATWHVLNALSGTALDLPAKTLHLSPKTGKSVPELHMPVFFSRFWLWVDYVPGRLLKLKVLRTFGADCSIETVAADAEAAPVRLPAPFLVKQGATLDLTEFMSRLVTHPAPRFVDYAVRESVSPRPGLPASGWTGDSGNVKDEYSRGGTSAAAFDGDPKTRWTTGHAMLAGDWMSVDMKQTHKVTKIVLDASGSPNDFPRGCTILASTNGKDWTEAAKLTRAECEARQKGGVLAVEPSMPVPARFIKIVQGETIQTLTYWSIHELYVYEKP